MLPHKLAPLNAALSRYNAMHLTRPMASAIKSAIRAALPGRQQKKNLDPFLDAGMKAAVRTLRRLA